MRAHLQKLQEAGVDQVVFLQQAGRNTHKNICESLQLFSKEVMPGFQTDVQAREAAKGAELKPFVEAALSRKEYMQALTAEQTPVVKASVKASTTDAKKQEKA